MKTLGPIASPRALHSDPFLHDPLFQDLPECPECGADMVVDYHNKSSLGECFKAHCPEGHVVEWEREND